MPAGVPVKVVTDHGWLFCPDGLPTAELPKHLTASKWARCAAIKGETQVPVPTAAWSWNPSEQFATPTGAACFNTGGSYATEASACRSASPLCWWSPEGLAAPLQRRLPRSAGRTCVATWKSVEPPLA